MMNQGQNGKNDWPMVPIFGRRKRPRQAFFAGPSQETSTAMSPTLPPNKIGPSYSAGYGNRKELEDIDQFEFEKDDMDLLGLEMTPSSTSMQRMGHKSNSNKENVSWSRKDTKQQHQAFQRKTTNIPLQSHLRNIQRQENRRREVYRVEQKIENVHLQEPKQRSSDVKVEQKPPEPKSPGRNRQPSVPRILTLTAYDIKELAGSRDKMMLALYEIYGILDSTVTSTRGECARRFTIRDATGSLRCIFWEIDRSFPQLRRGASIRCVGRICNNMFQCLSIRVAIQSEINDAKVLQKQSKDVIQKILVRSREF